MSYVGATLELEDLPKGVEWALIANSALAGGHGIMAASAGIEAIVDNDETNTLFIFPGNTCDAGIYLWTGTLEQALEGAGATWEQLHPENMNYWINHSGEEV